MSPSADERRPSVYSLPSSRCSSSSSGSERDSGASINHRSWIIDKLRESRAGTRGHDHVARSCRWIMSLPYTGYRVRRSLTPMSKHHGTIDPPGAIYRAGDEIESAIGTVTRSDVGVNGEIGMHHLFPAAVLCAEDVEKRCHYLLDV